jgi:pyruvate/2-oxoglutarate dehydrogenase complex dihydrolipoamide acyltransferase (E2) component
MDVVRAGQRMHVIHALLEVAVTTARAYLRQQKASTGEAFSFTAFIATCLARAVDENKYLHAYQKGRNQLVLFDEVDIAIPVEREQGGQRLPRAHIVRAANRKTVRQIHDEIRATQVKKVQLSREWKSRQWFVLLPTSVRAFLQRWARKHPHVFKSQGGTVGITSIGMFGKGGGWGIPVPYHHLFLTLGGISQKPGIVDEHLAIREYLCLTVSLNHEIIDGAPAARFISRLKELIESGFGLPDQDVMAEHAASTVGEAANEGPVRT